MSKRITEEQVEHWLGSDWSYSDTIELLTEIANDEYTPKTFAKDVLADTEDCKEHNPQAWAL